jgi:hypothetical protein
MSERHKEIKFEVFVWHEEPKETKWLVEWHCLGCQHSYYVPEDKSLDECPDCLSNEIFRFIKLGESEGDHDHERTAKMAGGESADGKGYSGTVAGDGGFDGFNQNGRPFARSFRNRRRGPKIRG